MNLLLRVSIIIVQHVGPVIYSAYSVREEGELPYPRTLVSTVARLCYRDICDKGFLEGHTKSYPLWHDYAIETTATSFHGRAYKA